MTKDFNYIFENKQSEATVKAMKANFFEILANNEKILNEYENRIAVEIDPQRKKYFLDKWTENNEFRDNFLEHYSQLLQDIINMDTSEKEVHAFNDKTVKDFFTAYNEELQNQESNVSNVEQPIENFEQQNVEQPQEEIQQTNEEQPQEEIQQTNEEQPQENFEQQNVEQENVEQENVTEQQEPVEAVDVNTDENDLTDATTEQSIVLPENEEEVQNGFGVESTGVELPEEEVEEPQETYEFSDAVTNTEETVPVKQEEEKNVVFEDEPVSFDISPNEDANAFEPVNESDIGPKEITINPEAYIEEEQKEVPDMEVVNEENDGMDLPYPVDIDNVDTHESVNLEKVFKADDNDAKAIIVNESQYNKLLESFENQQKSLYDEGFLNNDIINNTNNNSISNDSLEAEVTLPEDDVNQIADNSLEEDASLPDAIDNQDNTEEVNVEPMKPAIADIGVDNTPVQEEVVNDEQPLLQPLLPEEDYQTPSLENTDNTLNSPDVESMLEQANELYNNGQLDAAEAMYDEISQINQSSKQESGPVLVKAA